jgi:hypothetical protein
MNNREYGFVKVRIKMGASICHDHHFGRWPECCPPDKEYAGEEYQYIAKNTDMVFDARFNGKSWVCKADGYGYLASNGENGDYGNGSINVVWFDDVEILSEGDS